jgi:hypothetical protein
VEITPQKEEIIKQISFSSDTHKRDEGRSGFRKKKKNFVLIPNLCMAEIRSRGNREWKLLFCV